MLAELVGKLKEKLDRKKVAARSAGEEHPSGELRPNLDRLTVGVDLGDQGSHYCILGLEGETLAEGQLRTTQEDFASFFQGLNAARVVIEVGTHSAWVQEIIRGCGHEVLVANPRLMDGSKRRKRKNDRMDANKLVRLGRVDPESREKKPFPWKYAKRCCPWCVWPQPGALILRSTTKRLKSWAGRSMGIRRYCGR